MTYRGFMTHRFVEVSACASRQKMIFHKNIYSSMSWSAKWNLLALKEPANIKTQSGKTANIICACTSICA